MRRPQFRVLFDWQAYEAAVREAGGRRGWTQGQIESVLQRDRLCTVDVEDLDAHLDWHERLGFDAPKFEPAQG
jgi:hypothetical protein